MAYQVSLEFPDSMEEMGPKGTRDLSEHSALRALQDPKAVREQKGSRPRPKSLRKTGNNARGVVLVMEETMD